MGFGDIAGRFKKATEKTAPPPRVIDHEEMYAVRSKILGVLIRDARVAKGFSVEYLAAAMNVASDQIIDWEFGSGTPPSLPQLELLGYTLEVPVSHFLTSTETLIDQISQRAINQDEYQQTRDHMIGAMIRILRDQVGYTVEYLADQAAIDRELLVQYEYGYLPVPLPHLSAIASVLRVNVSFFLEGTNRVGRYLEAQEVFDTFLKMDPSVRQFVAKPSNHRFIELAMKMEAMEISKLRQIAEDILEITF